MVKCRQVLNILEQWAPRKLAEDWDNPGLLVGSPRQEIMKIMTCLDVSDEVVARAEAMGVQLIVAHHPLIFRGIRKIRTDLADGARLQRLLRADIAVIAAHTNLDSAPGGVNDVLARAIGLQDIGGFGEEHEASGITGTLGRIGYLAEPLTAREFAQKVKEALPCNAVRLVEAGEHPVHKVALCSGSGAEFIGKAALMGADAYVTGDVKYHEAQQARDLGIHLLDAGHFGTEFPIAAVLRDRLAEALAGQDVEVVADDFSQDFFQYI